MLFHLSGVFVLFAPLPKNRVAADTDDPLKMADVILMYVIKSKMTRDDRVTPFDTLSQFVQEFIKKSPTGASEGTKKTSPLHFRRGRLCSSACTQRSSAVHSAGGYQFQLLFPGSVGSPLELSVVMYRLKSNEPRLGFDIHSFFDIQS